ncbi:DUF4132 domain-containing protein [Streptomyces sp. NBC_01142]|uniref:DUF4132 domain-containing protein n=1 Tax=Streptomyces sp. NBC_01142 TaxID=2975865 RepID=UPI002256F133|nr:DUF4132 domain-containing protein [Streptomyces sp. NBC_01142]MCX4820482.1 DUF4132 domain-containing protein [Streptomyces sp. NBC_01142]
MTRWEYVDGGSAKFWEAEAEGSVVTIRFGRCGTTGRTQVKECASADAASDYLLKAVGEKERKGYREAGEAAPTAQAAQVSGASAVELPDEDTFTLPTAWRRRVHPRRGGIRRSPGTAIEDAAEKTGLRVKEEAEWIEEFLLSPKTAPQLAEAARAQLGGDANPVGAAVLAALTGIYPLPADAWADTWVSSYGLPFAAAAVVELFELDVHYLQRGQDRTDPWIGELGPSAPPYAASQRRPAADRVRALLAATDEATYREAVAALAERRGTDRRRIVASYLVPTETDWVAACCAHPGVSGEEDETVRAMLFCSLNSPDQVAQLGSRGGFGWYGWTVTSIGTVAEGVGPAVAPLLAEPLSHTYRSSDTVKLIAGVLCELPTDEAFGILLSHSDDKHVRPALLKAAHRYPVRALRMLAVADGPTARQLLSAHVGAHRDLVEAVLPTLGEEIAAALAPLLDRQVRIADAPADALPALLTSPPWVNRRPAAKAGVVAGLTAVSEPAVSWLPGEQQEWADTPSWHRSWSASQTWMHDAEALRRELRSGSVRSAGAFIHAPAELIRPLLDDWDPDDLWDGADVLKPIVARFEESALGLLLRVAARQPSSLGPLLLPYVDVRVARQMADWAIRLTSTAGTARSWFVRHGAAAAALLVPDAVGKAGPARRRAEHALRLIAAAHSTETVRTAASAYGPEAVAVVDETLSADPLENALPTRMPEPVEWAEPTLLPQILVRTGEALPADATRHAVTMLALSKPGETYPGIAVLKEVCDAGSLAEFVWALFEQWRLSGMPSKQSWALHALGLLGDDETVRRLTPLVRVWPGEGAHHRAVEGLDVLASIGTDVALLHLHGVAQRVKFKALKVRAQEKIAVVAESLGLTGEQLADRLVPDFGLSADGSTVIDYGTRRFTVGFDEQLRPYVLDQDGKRRKDLPQPGARDDAELAPAERKRFMALKKDVRTIASDQMRRLETAMVAGRSWPAAEFCELFVQHPLLWHLVRRLVWLSESAGTVTAFRVAEDRTFADVEDDEFTLPEDASVRLPHPLHLGDSLSSWSEVFADYEILQPFPQLGRPLYAPTDQEAQGSRLTRFEGITVPTGKLLGLQRRGWERGTPQDAGVERWFSKKLAPERYLVIDLYEGIAVGALDVFPDQKLETIWLGTAPGDFSPRAHHPLRFGDLDPVAVSEVLADLLELAEAAK